MSRASARPVSDLHLRIRRLVVDADALGPDGAPPHDLDALLRSALSARLGGEAVAAAAAAPPQWIGSIADSLAVRVHDAASSSESAR